MQTKNNTRQGYWKNKRRDSHTLRRLSESKYVKVIQYNKFGDLIKIWDSIKDVAQIVFDDYRVVNGGSQSIVYDILNCTTIKSRFKVGYYWFKEIELLNKFGKIPQKINILALRQEEIQKRRLAYKKSTKSRTHVKKYCVLHYDERGKFIARYNSSKHAAYKLKTTQKIIERICTGKTKNPVYNLKYGEKTLQPINESYPQYEVQPIIRPRKEYQKTRTRYQIIQYDEFDNQIRVFNDTMHCHKVLKISESQIRLLCLGKRDYIIFKRKKIILKYGEKKQIIYGN